RMKAEEALKASEYRYRSLFENMLEGYALCRLLPEGKDDDDFLCLTVNHSFERMTGTKNADGMRFSEAMPGIRNAKPELIRICRLAAKTGVPQRLELFVDD